MSDVESIRFPIAVATASDSTAVSASITTASALPKLKEWPTVPEEVLIPLAVSFQLFQSNFAAERECPANIPRILFLELFK